MRFTFKIPLSTPPLLLPTVEARQEAGYQADKIDYNAASLKQKADEAKGKADRDKAKAKLDEEKFNETKRHNRAKEATDRIRAAKAGKGGGDLTAAYDYWMSLDEKQKQQYRDWNKRKTEPIKDAALNIIGYKYKPDDEKFIELVYNQRTAWLRNNGNKPKPTAAKSKPTVPKRKATTSNGKKPTGVNWK